MNTINGVRIYKNSITHLSVEYIKYRKRFDITLKTNTGIFIQYQVRVDMLDLPKEVYKSKKEFNQFTENFKAYLFRDLNGLIFSEKSLEFTIKERVEFIMKYYKIQYKGNKDENKNQKTN